MQARAAYIGLDDYLARALLERLLVHLGPEVRRRPTAWSAFNKLILDGMRATLDTLAAGQATLRQGQLEMRRQLDALLARFPTAADLLAWSDATAAGLTDIGVELAALRQDQQERLDDLFARIV